MTYPLRGALTGILVGLATVAIVTGAFRCSAEGLECLPVVLLALGAALLVGLLLGWLALRLLRARMAALLATAGLVLTLLIVAVVGDASPAHPLVMPAMAAAGYATSALALAPRTPRVVKVGFGVLLAAGLLVLISYL
ncbi:MAG TPA: hypothetical protein VIL37_11075 [Natronosporangium sp.]